MANMPYARFRNALPDLHDCYEHIFDNLSPKEEIALRQMYHLCKKFVADLEDAFPEEEEYKRG